MVTQKLASMISESGMPNYTQRMQVLQQLVSTWEAGNTAAVVEVVSTTEIIPSTSREMTPESTPHTDSLP